MCTFTPRPHVSGYFFKEEICFSFVFEIKKNKQTNKEKKTSKYVTIEFLPSTDTKMYT